LNGSLDLKKKIKLCSVNTLQLFGIAKHSQGRSAPQYNFKYLPVILFIGVFLISNIRHAGRERIRPRPAQA
jgi:hypothetical protein